jgi:DNA-binding GntR family transcriptional regulator
MMRKRDGVTIPLTMIDGDAAPFVTAQHEVYRHLREQILSGTLKAGARLNPLDIGKSLGVSRMPVREALRQLDSEGLVTIKPNRGVVVMSLSTREIEEIFLIRTSLEVLAARQAVPNLTARTITGLQQHRRLMDEAEGDARLWVRRHDDFHDALCGLSGMPRLVAEIRRSRALLNAYMTRYYMEASLTPEMDGHGHDAIIDALRSYNPNLIEACIRDHVMGGSQAVIGFVEAQARRALEEANAG